MMTRLTCVLALAAAWPSVARAQEYDVSRRSFTFLDERLVVLVETEAPGTLRVVRGGRGQVEVAGRARDGFVGFGLGGDPTQQLRLTSVGGEQVEYLVVVPEYVRLTVQLPDRRGSDVASRQPSAVFRWGAATDTGTADALLPTHGGMYMVHTSTWAPGVVDIPDLAAVRSISVRFEPGEFRIAASRPLTLGPGTGRTAIELRVTGEPTALTIYVPATASGFMVRAAGRTIVSSAGGRPGSSCSGVAVQQPSREQIWFNFYPRAGRIECR